MSQTLVTPTTVGSDHSLVPSQEYRDMQPIIPRIGVWTSALLPHLTDDVVLIKLWCTTPMMQQLMTTKVTAVTSWVRDSYDPQQQYLWPSFLPQLRLLKQLHVWQPPSSTYTKLPILGLERLPRTIQKFDTNMLLPIPIESWLMSHPYVALGPIMHNSLNHNTYQVHLWKQLLELLKQDQLPQADQLQAFTQLLRGINSTILATIYRILASLPQQSQDWLRRQCAPEIRKLNITSTLTPVILHWVYQLFPNIEHVHGGAVILPPHVTSYSESSILMMLHNAAIPVLPPSLTSLKLEARSDDLTLPIFPPQLTSLSLHNITEHIITAFPTKLTNLTLSYRGGLPVLPALPPTLTVVNIYASEYSRDNLYAVITALPIAVIQLSMKISSEVDHVWDREVISALPRNLRELTVITFPCGLSWDEYDEVDPLSSSWAGLPGLSTFNIKDHFERDFLGKYVDQVWDADYATLAASLTKLDSSISDSSTLSHDHRSLQWSTLNTFQKLVELRLNITDAVVLTPAHGNITFPNTITSLTLEMDFEPDDMEVLDLSKLIWPTSLVMVKLNMQEGNLYATVDAVKWQLFPDSIIDLTLAFKFRSYPQYLPSSLRTLELDSEDEITCGDIIPLIKTIYAPARCRIIIHGVDYQYNTASQELGLRSN